MAKKTDTLRDPVLEAFGEAYLIKLNSRELRTGLEKLKLMQAEAIETIAAIRKGTVDGIINGQAGAIDAILQPGADMEQAQRWKQAIEAATEAADQALEMAESREKDAVLSKRRKAISEALEQHYQAAERVEQAAQTLSAALMDMDRHGVECLRVAGVRLSGNLAQAYMCDQSQHLINLALHAHTGGLWKYDRVPPLRGHFPIDTEARNVGADLMRLFEERIERNVGRTVDWEPAQEAAAGGA
jgi:hypothetical protein